MVTYTATNVRYSERDFQCLCDVWEGGSGSDKMALIRFEGGGMNRSDKQFIESQFDFFSDALRDPADQVGGFYEANDDVVVFSCNYVMHRVQAESSTGSDAEGFKPSSGFSMRYSSNPGYMDRWILCVLDAIEFVKRNAVTYGVSLDKIWLSGSSAGAMAVSAAAYLDSIGYSTLSSAFNTRPNVSTLNTDVAGMILHDAPLDLTAEATIGGIFNPFVGVMTDQTPWSADLQERVRHVSALKILEDTQKKPDVFSWYNGTYDATQVIGGSGSTHAGAHDPAFGVAHHNRIQSLYGGDGTGLDKLAGVRPAHALYVKDDASGFLAACGNNAWADTHNFNPQIGTVGLYPITQLRAFLTTLGYL
ncbi:MAG: hypothetical protein ACI88C_000054 [Acidimicrobiales bacterium]|jgi:hypothetical protein